MSVRCPDCGAIAGYGQEIGHKSDCPSLERANRIGRIYRNMPKGDDATCTTGPSDPRDARLLELVNIFEAAYWKSWREHHGTEPTAARIAGVEALMKVLPGPPQSSSMRTALEDVSNWLDGCLRCTSWSWDGLQREAAEDALKEARACLALSRPESK